MAVKKKQKKEATYGVAHIKSSFNNTIITLCDLAGNTLTWVSSGVRGFKGTRKSTPFAAQLSAKLLVTRASEMGIKKMEIIVKGRGGGRESAIRTLLTSGLRIVSLEDRTSTPHNGCRPPKKRRL